MLRFGGTLTLNGLVVYVAYNFEKVLLGRFWGAEAIGLYGRAYQLITFRQTTSIPRSAKSLSRRFHAFRMTLLASRVTS